MSRSGPATDDFEPVTYRSNKATNIKRNNHHNHPQPGRYNGAPQNKPRPQRGARNTRQTNGRADSARANSPAVKATENTPQDTKDNSALKQSAPVSSEPQVKPEEPAKSGSDNNVTTKSESSPAVVRNTIPVFSYKQALMRGMQQPVLTPVQTASKPVETTHDSNTTNGASSKPAHAQNGPQNERPTSAKRPQRQATNVTYKQGSLPQRQRAKHTQRQNNNHTSIQSDKHSPAVDAATKSCDDRTKPEETSSKVANVCDSNKNIESVKTMQSSESVCEEKTVAEKTVVTPAPERPPLSLDSIKDILAKINSEIAVVKNRASRSANSNEPIHTIAKELPNKQVNSSDIDTSKGDASILYNMKDKDMQPVEIANTCSEDKMPEQSATCASDKSNSSEENTHESNANNKTVCFSPETTSVALPTESSSLLERLAKHHKNRAAHCKQDTPEQSSLDSRQHLESYPLSLLEYTEELPADTGEANADRFMKTTNRFHPLNKKHKTPIEDIAKKPGQSKFNLLQPIQAKPKEKDIYDTLAFLEEGKQEENIDIAKNDKNLTPRTDNGLQEESKLKDEKEAEEDFSMPDFSGLSDKPNDFFFTFPPEEEEEEEAAEVEENSGSEASIEDEITPDKPTPFLTQHHGSHPQNVPDSPTVVADDLVANLKTSGGQESPNGEEHNNLDELLNFGDTDKVLQDFQQKMVQLRAEMANLRKTKVLRRIVDLDDRSSDNAEAAVEPVESSLEQATPCAVSSRDNVYCPPFIQNEACANAKHLSSKTAVLKDTDLLQDPSFALGSETNIMREDGVILSPGVASRTVDCDSVTCDVIKGNTNIDTKHATYNRNISTFRDDITTPQDTTLTNTTTITPSTNTTPFTTPALPTTATDTSSVKSVDTTRCDELDNTSSGSGDQHETDTGFDGTGSSDSEADDDAEAAGQRGRVESERKKRRKFMDEMEKKMELYFRLQDHMQEMQMKMRELQGDMVRTNKLLIGMMENTVDDLYTACK